MLLALTGFFVGGPSNIICSAISADLGRQEALRGSQEALATVTGIVDGTGSMGAAVGQVMEYWEVLYHIFCYSSSDDWIMLTVNHSNVTNVWFRVSTTF